jgi:FAD/FMN-containing dehydrogenase
MVEARSSMAGAAQADLVDRLGRDRVALGEAARRLAGFDPQGREGPIAVARPTTVEHVEHVIKVGRLRHAPVEVRGRLPGNSPEDLRDAIVLDTSGLQRPPAIDISRRVVTVGAGVEVASVDRAARQARLCVRGLPSALTGDTIGALLATGEPGELGLGDGTLLSDVVSALVVTGGGRILRIGSSDLLGHVPWLGEGVAHPLAMLLAGEGRMAVVCEVTLRLHRAPHVAWASAQLPGGRAQLLAVLTAGRSALSARVTDSVLVREQDGQLHLDVRAVTWRGEDDLPAAVAVLNATLQQHGVPKLTFRNEDKRVRLGQQAGSWPEVRDRTASLDMRVAWPDVATVLDVVDALSVESGQPVPRAWALGQDFVRLRCELPLPTVGMRADQHPLMLRVGLLVEAGAVPISSSARLRHVARDRMPPAAKVLMTALARAWDPEGVLSPRVGGS